MMGGGWYWVIDKFSHAVYSEHPSKVGSNRTAKALRKKGFKVVVVKVEIVENA